jgi:hypothetical protein
MLPQSLLSAMETGNDLLTTREPHLKQRSGFFSQRRFIDIRHAERFLNGRWQERFNARSGWQHASLRTADPQGIKLAPYGLQWSQHLNAVMRGFWLEHRRGQTVPPDTESGLIGLMRQKRCK